MNQHLRHQCLIYAGAPSEQLPAIAKIITEKLNSGYRCLCMDSPDLLTELKSHLAAIGISLSEQDKQGALLLSSDRSHMVNGKFQVDLMISKLQSATKKSLAEGFVGLWAYGDITWEFGAEVNLQTLIDYECKLEQVVEETPEIQGICLYHMDTLPIEIIQHALHAHQGVFINDSLSRRNPHYLPRELLSKERPTISDSVFQKMLTGLGIVPYPDKAASEFE